MNYFKIIVESTIDYYPFGQEMPGRVYSPTSYRYGFNGKENDNEVAGTGNWQNYGMREYDARVCRFISVDPLAGKYASYSPYCAFVDNPVLFVDKDGREIWILGPPGSEPVLYVPNQTAIQKDVSDYVKTVSSTLDKIVNSDYDKFNIINILATDCSNVLIKPGEWDKRLGVSANGTGTGIGGGEIPWSPEGGDVIKNCGRRSPASLLLHELGEIFYAAYDPEGKLARQNSFNMNTEEGLKQFDEFIKTQSKECGAYQTYNDKWIITNVEHIPGEAVRTEHDFEEMYKADNPFSLKGPTKSEINESDKSKKGNNNSNSNKSNKPMF